MLGFLLSFGKFKALPGATLLCFAFSTTVPKYGPKKFKKRQIITKTIYPLFRDPNINVRIYQAQLFYVLRFPLRYLKTAQKTVQSSRNAEKLPKPFSNFSEILYKDKSSGKIPFLKKLTLWFI